MEATEFPRPIAKPRSLPVASLGEHVRREANYLAPKEQVSIVRTIDGRQVRITLEVV